MFNQCIYFNLVTLTRKISKIWQNEFEKLGLSPSHGYLLFAIVENPDTRQKKLSELMELDASTVTRFIDTLANKGLLERSAKGKGALIFATEDGKQKYISVKKSMDKLYQQMQIHFGAKEFKTFVNSLYNAKQSLTQN